MQQRPAFADPLWLSALLLLALNDHVFKALGDAPLITGKLSDFAGLLVLPSALALLPWLRRPVPWRVLHLAIAVGFTLLQLSPHFVLALNSILDATLGLTWTVFADPTDLFALTVLPLSLLRFAPFRERPTPLRPSKTVHLFCGGLAWVFCVATSAPDPEPRCCDAGRIQADAFLLNETERPLLLRLRQLHPSVDLDCDAVAAAPSQYLRPDLFGPAKAWTLPSRTAIPLRDQSQERRCYAAWVDGAELDSQLFFYFAQDLPYRPIEAYIDREIGDPFPEGGIIIDEQDTTLHLHTLGSSRVAILQRSALALFDPPAHCPSLNEASRVAWGHPVGPQRKRQVAARRSVDGCLWLEMQNTDSGSIEGYPVCIPDWPFQDGDELELQSEFSPELKMLSVRRTTADESTELIVFSGTRFPSLDEPINTRILPRSDCPLSRSADCPSVQQAATVAISIAGIDYRLEYNVDWQVAVASGAEYRFTLLRAAYRSLVDSRCSGGSSKAGADLEGLVLVRRPAP
ncbi:MAG: hypothetical protein RBU37_01725 [Myxococcota bacterium]|jgi:hypothetical protein|nr:hypothetical protein [Myxococcota bacterium]